MSKYTPYHAASAKYAIDLCRGAKTPKERYDRITAWVSRSIGYDYIRATKIAKLKGQAPDIYGCWSKRMGICMDISALTVNMLKAVGIRAFVCIGHADGNYHAWVEAIIGNQRYRYDHSGKAKVYRTERAY